MWVHVYFEDLCDTLLLTELWTSKKLRPFIYVFEIWHYIGDILKSDTIQAIFGEGGAGEKILHVIHIYLIPHFESLCDTLFLTESWTSKKLVRPYIYVLEIWHYKGNIRDEDSGDKILHFICI